MVEDDEPVSPMGQYFSNSVLSLTILVVFEVEVPIDEDGVLAPLVEEFLFINPRFSSIMVTDNRGRPIWRKTSLKLEDHVKVPVFAGDSVGSYDEQLQDYISRIGMEQLPPSRPLWEVHLIKYPTGSGAAGTAVLKLHHALGDGFSLMGALLSKARRRDDPSLPITFPSARTAPGERHVLARVLRRFRRGLCSLINTGGDFSRLLLKNRLLEDDRTPLRSGEPGVEFRPVAVSSAVFSLKDIREIKNKLNATVNDVLTGMVFYGIHLYLHLHPEGQQCSKAARITTIVLANTRSTKTYHSMEEMVTKGDGSKRRKAPWGNHLGMLFVSIPKCDDAMKADPTKFVSIAKKIIKKKKNSFDLFLTDALLQTISKIKGSEAAAKYMYACIRSTTLSISNLIGPMEQVTMADHPIKSFYFVSTGVPQSLNINVVSYAGNVRIVAAAEKGFIDSQLLMACIEKAFKKISESACDMAP